MALGKNCRHCDQPALANYAFCQQHRREYRNSQYQKARDNPKVKVCGRCGVEHLSRYTHTICVKCKHVSKRSLEAKPAKCACGCGQEILNMDLAGRAVMYVPGHNSLSYKKHADSRSRKKAWAKQTRNRKASKERERVKVRKRKLAMMEAKGNQCLDCGLAYSGQNGAVFNFHHLDPSDKSFNLGRNTTYSAEAVAIELEKCVLLCRNCHEIRHKGVW